jgi:hypothetical protein
MFDSAIGKLPPRTRLPISVTVRSEVPYELNEIIFCLVNTGDPQYITVRAKIEELNVS